MLDKDQDLEVGASYKTRSGVIVKITHYDFIADTKLWLGEYEVPVSFWFWKWTKQEYAVYYTGGKRLRIPVEDEMDLIEKL